MRGHACRDKAGKPRAHYYNVVAISSHLAYPNSRATADPRRKDRD